MRNTATSQDIILVPHSNRNPLARLPRAALSAGRKSPTVRRLRIPQLSTCISRASIWRNGTLTADGQGIDPRAIPSWVPQLRVIGSRRPMPRPTHLVCSPAPMHVGWPGGGLIGECRWSLGVLRTAALSCLIPSCPPRHSILSAFAQTLGWHEGLYISASTRCLRSHCGLASFSPGLSAISGRGQLVKHSVAAIFEARHPPSLLARYKFPSLLVFSPHSPSQSRPSPSTLSCGCPAHCLFRIPTTPPTPLPPATVISIPCLSRQHESHVSRPRVPPLTTALFPFPFLSLFPRIEPLSCFGPVGPWHPAAP